MRTITPAVINAASRSFETIFNKALAEVKTTHELVAAVVNSTTAENVYASLGDTPMLREWLGDRVIKALEAGDYTIRNKKFEATIGVKEDDIEDENLGLYPAKFEQLGQNAARHPDKLIWDLVKAGNSTLCFDGQNFFDTDHPVGDGTKSNWGGGASYLWVLMDTTQALKPLIWQSRRKPRMITQDDPKFHGSAFMRGQFYYGVDYRGNAGFGLWQCAYGSKDTLNETNYEAARQAMSTLTNDEGEPLEINPNLLVVSPENEAAAKKLIKAERLDSGESNIHYNEVEVLKVNRLAGT